MLGERAARARDDRQRRAQIVRDRREQRIAQALGFGRDARRFGLLGQLRALHREPELSGKRFEQMTLLGQQDAPPVRRQHGEHAEPLTLIAQWNIQRWRRRQRVGAETRALAMIDDPLRDRQVGLDERAFERRFAG